MSPENCKAGALPTELHPHADLQFCIAPRPMHGSTALNSTKHHRNFEWRGPGVVGGGSAKAGSRYSDPQEHARIVSTLQRWTIQAHPGNCADAGGGSTI